MIYSIKTYHEITPPFCAPTVEWEFGMMIFIWSIQMKWINESVQIKLDTHKLMKTIPIAEYKREIGIKV